MLLWTHQMKRRKKLGCQTGNIDNPCEVVAYKRRLLIIRREENPGRGVITTAKQESSKITMANR